MRVGSTKHRDVGRRVEIPAYSDMWMRGARFGTVVRVIDRSNDGRVAHADRTDIWRVRLDHPQAGKRLFGYVGEECRVID